MKVPSCIGIAVCTSLALPIVGGLRLHGHESHQRGGRCGVGEALDETRESMIKSALQLRKTGQQSKGEDKP